MALATWTLPDDLPAGKLPVTVTYLEMAAAPAGPARPRPDGVDGPVHARNCPTAYYRFLYDTVGEPWLWEYRRRMAPERLAEILADPAVEVHVVSVQGVPAGYIELDAEKLSSDGAMDVAYFGLMPWAIGRGIGPWLLDWGVRLAWTKPAVRRLTVNTCTFDHPSALGLYQRVGFKALRTEDKLVDDPRLTGLLPRSAAPHIPLARHP
ncbi:GNAT family N-acetyltransferase [Nitrospirillum sp. BR 11164]|uniref:GNAT family N-acetyltransferase n=1 Tax=Nitrospirillum sp. BR 11164 TaxID=3104324 RepID=UPI002AFFDAC9|nr:GNAT family N-acetyltransferase [Nitrospirillum sp. BR 11164]MEA1652085.1 GNAT family N-acetyltransferase [Nitrospirillum sp. BR 11164]